MQKRDPKKKKYLPYLIPKDRFCPLYSRNMELVINCTSCGKTMKFGEGYTSIQIHNDIGLGYPVCSDCYEKEKK